MKEDDEESEIDSSLPKDNFTAEKFQEFWNHYLKKIQKKNKPAYNVLQTSQWRITVDYNIELIFDSSVMVLEFDKLKDDFLVKVREKLNNFHIQIETKISTSKETKSHVKNRKEKYEDLIKLNPLVETLFKELDLDINNEP